MIFRAPKLDEIVGKGYQTTEMVGNTAATAYSKICGSQFITATTGTYKVLQLVKARVWFRDYCITERKSA